MVFSLLLAARLPDLETAIEEDADRRLLPLTA
jgi:hypothetical protein